MPPRGARLSSSPKVCLGVPAKALSLSSSSLIRNGNGSEESNHLQPHPPLRTGSFIEENKMGGCNDTRSSSTEMSDVRDVMSTVNPNTSSIAQSSTAQQQQGGSSQRSMPVLCCSRVLASIMFRFSYAWVVWVALVVAGGEASPGDRNWLYATCLDT